VSPKSGRAVGRDAGAPWRERLLPYPRFLQDERAPAEPPDVAGAFCLTGHFLTRDVFAPRGGPLPPSRQLYLEALEAGISEARRR
jgi:DNA repair protein RecO (recombination protein O)